MCPARHASYHYHPINGIGATHLHRTLHVRLRVIMQYIQQLRNACSTSVCHVTITRLSITVRNRYQPAICVITKSHTHNCTHAQRRPTYTHSIVAQKPCCSYETALAASLGVVRRQLARQPTPTAVHWSGNEKTAKFCAISAVALLRNFPAATVFSVLHI